MFKATLTISSIAALTNGYLKQVFIRLIKQSLNELNENTSEFEKFKIIKSKAQKKFENSGIIFSDFALNYFDASKLIKRIKNLSDTLVSSDIKLKLWEELLDLCT